MQVGLGLPHYGELAQAPEIARFAAAAERLGYRSLWVGDRVLTPTAPSDVYPGGGTPQRPYPAEFTRFLDPLVALSAAATATTSMRLGTSTLIGPLHSPLLLGRTLTSLDLLSEGRLDVGLGLGWMRDEYAANRVPWSERGKRLDELLDALIALWTREPVEHYGQFWEIPESTMNLRPTQRPRPPVLLGGASQTALRRIGERADGWLPGGLLPDMLRGQWEVIRAAAERAGRDPGALRTVLRLNPQPGTSASQIGDQLATAHEMGFLEAFVDPHFVADTVDDALELADKLTCLLPGA